MNNAIQCVFMCVFDVLSLNIAGIEDDFKIKKNFQLSQEKLFLTRNSISSRDS